MVICKKMSFLAGSEQIEAARKLIHHQNKYQINKFHIDQRAKISKAIEGIIKVPPRCC